MSTDYAPPVLYVLADLDDWRDTGIPTPRDVAAYALSRKGVEWVLIEVPEPGHVRLTISGGDRSEVEAFVWERMPVCTMLEVLTA